MTARDRTGRFTAERTTQTTTVTERVTIEPAPGPLLPEAQARLAPPLPYPSPPVIFTPAMRAEWDQFADQIRAGRETDQEDLDAWHGKAVLATHGPLLEWMHRPAPPVPAMLP